MPSIRRPLRLALPLILAACGGDSASSPDTKPLSLADAQSIVRAFAPQMMENMISVRGISAGSTSMQKVTCPQGGSVGVSLQGGSGAGAVVTIVHTACTVVGPDGHRWTLNGDPNIRLEIGSVTLPTTPGGEASLSIAMTGALRVDGDSASGRCAIDTIVEFRASTSAPISSRTRYTGKVCGEVVDETFTHTVS